jgi:hypothetical protein
MKPTWPGNLVIQDMTRLLAPLTWNDPPAMTASPLGADQCHGLEECPLIARSGPRCFGIARFGRQATSTFQLLNSVQVLIPLFLEPLYRPSAATRRTKVAIEAKCRRSFGLLAVLAASLRRTRSFGSIFCAHPGNTVLAPVAVAIIANDWEKPRPTKAATAFF